MNFTTEKLIINIEGLSIKEAGLLKWALLMCNKFEFVEPIETPIVSSMIVAIDQAVDQVVSFKYKDKVFGDLSNIGDYELLDTANNRSL